MQDMHCDFYQNKITLFYNFIPFHDLKRFNSTKSDVPIQIAPQKAMSDQRPHFSATNYIPKIRGSEVKNYLNIVNIYFIKIFDPNEITTDNFKFEAKGLKDSVIMASGIVFPFPKCEINVVLYVFFSPSMKINPSKNHLSQFCRCRSENMSPLTSVLVFYLSFLVLLCCTNIYLTIVLFKYSMASLTDTHFYARI